MKVKQLKMELDQAWQDIHWLIDTKEELRAELDAIEAWAKANNVPLPIAQALQGVRPPP